MLPSHAERGDKTRVLRESNRTHWPSAKRPARAHCKKTYTQNRAQKHTSIPSEDERGAKVQVLGASNHRRWPSARRHGRARCKKTYTQNRAQKHTLIPSGDEREAKVRVLNVSMHMLRKFRLLIEKNSNVVNHKYQVAYM